MIDSSKNLPYFLQGGGEMGKLMRAKDWSKTPLGVPSQWPHTLQTMVSVLLENPFGMYIAWGKEFTQLYNDGYRPILGESKHPHALGISTKESFPEVWEPTVIEIFHDVMSGKSIRLENLMLQLDRNGYLENCYFDLSYSPIRIESGEVGGILVTIIETTAQKLAEEAEIENRNQLEFAIETAQLGTFDYNPITNKFVANYRLKQWFGLSKNNEVELSDALNVMSDNDKKRVKTAITSALEGSQDGKYDVEYTIINPDTKKEIIVHAMGKTWFNDQNLAYRLNGTVEDITKKVIARKKVEENEQSIRALVESAPFPIAVYTGSELLITLANQSIMDAWGKGKDVVGKLYTDILPELGNQKIFDQIRNVLQTGIAFHAKNERIDLVIDNELKTFYFNYSFTPLFDVLGKVYGVMNTAAEVTELHMAKQKVEESEKRFRNSVEQAPLGIAVFRGPEFIAEMANSNYLLLIDRSEQEFLGKSLFKSLPEITELVEPIFNEVVGTGEAFYAAELPAKLKRHGIIEQAYFNLVYHPLKEENGEINAIMVVATEVTNHVKAKHLLEENEERLNIVINASELGIWEYDVKTQTTSTSKRCQEIFGVLGETYHANTSILNSFHPEDMHIREKAFKKAYATGIMHYELRVIWKDGTIRWIENKGKVFFNDTGEPERLLGTIRDVTNEKNFQQELLAREEKFRLLADSMPQHVWTSTPEGNLNYFNQSVFDFSGLSLEEITKVTWLDIVHPADRDNNIHQWTKSIRTGKDFLIEHRFRKHDGQYRWQLSRAIPQKDQDGNITMWVGTSTDIQDQKMFAYELEKKVNERTKELNLKNIDLEKMNKELQSFAYISSHDLQEPLRKIQTIASIISEKELENLSDSGKDKFLRMQKAANRMQTLIQDLLAYSRTSTQKIKFEKSNLRDIIDDVKDDLNEELHRENATIELGSMCDVKVIPFQFRQLLSNLVSNAIKFAKNTDKPLIKIESEIAKGSKFKVDKLSKNTTYCHIKFTDNGIGFEQKYSEKIFVVFQRLHGKDQYNGTGIGLAIVKKIIENHKGVIVASAKLNQGATFDIYIPS